MIAAQTGCGAVRVPRLRGTFISPPRVRRGYSLTQLFAMRAVVQRVKSASVTVSLWRFRDRSQCSAVACFAGTLLPMQQVDGQEISRIGAGLLCLIGVRAQDTLKDADFMQEVACVTVELIKTAFACC